MAIASETDQRTTLLSDRLHPPRLHRLVRRERLFMRLNELRERHNVIWCHASAGAGKTSVIASYLADRGETPLWYQLDASDVDPAIFFRNIALAARALTPDPIALPLLTPEYLLAARVYAANFFETLFRSTGERCCIVLDNYQDAGDRIALHDMLESAFQAAPDGAVIFVISRHEPPAEFDRLRASPRMGALDFQDLRLDRTELQDLARLLVADRTLNVGDLERLHEATGGWMAGLVLFLQQLDHSRWQALDTARLEPQQVFDYFASDVFARAPVATRDFLTVAALLPFMGSENTRALTGHTHPTEMLAQLAARNFFTTHIQGREDTYEFHPLFRAFLRQRFDREIPVPIRAALLRRAGELLAASGQIEDAARNFVQASDWDRLTQLILGHGQRALLGGQWQTVLAWIAALPPKTVAENPWLLYTRALALMAADLAGARETFWLALQRFLAHEDPAGAYLALSGGIDTFNYLWIDFKPLDKWLDTFDELQRKFPRIPSPDIEARVIYAMFSGHMWRRPHVPAMEHWATQARRLFETCPDATTRVMVGSYLLLFHLWWRGQPLRADVIIDEVRIVAQRHDVGILARLFWHVMESSYLYFRNDGHGAVQAARHGLELAKTSGVPMLSLLLHAQAIYGHLTSFNTEGAVRQLAEMQVLLQDETTFDFAHYHYLATWVHLGRNDPRLAMEHARIGVEAADRIAASIYPYFSRVALAQACHESGDSAQATQIMDTMSEWSAQVGLSYMDCQRLYLEADVALTRNDTAAFSNCMRQAWEIHETNGHAMLPWIGWRRTILQRLYAACIRHDVGAVQARAMLEQRHLRAPQDLTDDPQI